MVLGFSSLTDVNHHTYFVEEFGDGPHGFAMLMGGIRELQIKCKVGINDLYLRICAGHWYVDDLREVIRVGLIEAGLDPIEALRMIERYVDGRPLYSSLALAVKILSKSLLPDDEDEILKKKAEALESDPGSQDTTSNLSTETVQ